jgi:hypothetical protein
MVGRLDHMVWQEDAATLSSCSLLNRQNRFELPEVLPGIKAEPTGALDRHEALWGRSAQEIMIS